MKNSLLAKLTLLLYLGIYVCRIPNTRDFINSLALMGSLE